LLDICYGQRKYAAEIEVASGISVVDIDIAAVDIDGGQRESETREDL
jgi:hypothetical protein